MKTILTDDEIHKWWASENGMEDADLARLYDFREVIRKAEAAVLAKLVAQEPVAQPTAEMFATFKAAFEGGSIWTARVNHGLEQVFRAHKLYAAPQPAVVQVPQDFDYKHPRAQALIGADARHRIVIDLVVNCYWAQPGEFENPGVYYWDGAKNVLCVPHLAAAPEAPAQADNLTTELQQRCSDWGVYWRAPDAHGVVLTVEQAAELLRDALGVEVEIKSPAHPIPPQWREAMKVARWALEGWANHGTWVWPESALEQCKRNTTEALAAIALADSLEGGE